MSIADLADEKEENIKEKSKEFIADLSAVIIIPGKDWKNFQYSSHSLPAPLHTIEIPPPDSCI